MLLHGRLHTHRRQRPSYRQRAWQRWVLHTQRCTSLKAISVSAHVWALLGHPPAAVYFQDYYLLD
jgi:hypothetical protein